MARPRNKLFYENPLPETLPPEKEWLHDYHRNSQMLVEYLVANGVLSTAYHSTIRCLTQFREYLLDKGLGFSSENIKRWCAENKPLFAGYEITLYRLLDFYQHGCVQPINAYPHSIQYCTELNVILSIPLYTFPPRII